MGARLIQWTIFEWNEQVVNNDLFWLYTGFLRLTAGQDMVGNFYETNPPLSVFIYTPAFLLAKYGILELWHATIVYTMIIVGLSVLATTVILRKIPFLTKSQVALMSIGLFISGTIMTSPYFGQRDHLIAMAAVPVTLLLLARTWHYKVSHALGAPLLILGTICLLLKPYYGLLPAVLMLHRVIVSKRVTAVFDIDFLIMATVTGAYAAALVPIFPDYLTIILPDVTSFYATSNFSMNVPRAFFLAGAWIFVMCLTLDNAIDMRIRIFIHFLLLLSALCFFIFLIMMKGFAYHLIPFKSFLVMAGLLALYGETSKIIPNKKNRIGFLISALVCLTAICPRDYFPSSATIREQPLTRILSDCGENCRFMMMGGTVRIVQLTSYYSGREHASRFPNLWFMEALQKPGYSKKEEKYKYYAGLVAEDIAFYKAEIILSCEDMGDPVKTFSQFKAFKTSFTPYKWEQKLSYNYNIYFNKDDRKEPFYVACDLYRRSK